MQIAVLLKIVSETHFTDALDAPKERLSSGQLAVNPADAYALENALRIRDQDPETVVTVLTMAPPVAEFYLRHALAMGADRAVHICDGRLAGSDTLATAKCLAAAIRTLPPQDLILCGQKAIDSETGHIGPELGVLLGIPCVTNVLHFGPDGGSFKAQRLQEEGLMELRSPRGSLFTVCRGVAMIREPGILDIRQAAKKSVIRYSGDQIGLEPGSAGLKGSPTRVVRTRPIDHHSRDAWKTSDPGEGASMIRKLLRKDGERDA